MHLAGEMIAIALPVTCVLFALVWAVCVRLGNYGFLDVAWTLSIGALAVGYAAFGYGDADRRLAFAAVGAFWSLRLATYVFIRVSRHHPQEDARYRTLRETWRGPVRFLLFFELQALIAVLFSVPFLLAALNPHHGLRAVEIVGLLLALAATLGESLADWQAHQFKSNARNRGAILNVGLWRYSRHPNYFFESLVWWGFFIAALGSAWGWTTVICPLLMLYILLNVTGVPLTEKHSLEHRGEAYRDYQRTTSRFIPWIKKQPAPSQYSNGASP